MSAIQEAYAAMLKAGRSLTVDFGDTVEIRTKTIVSDGQGGHTTTYPITQTLPGKRRPATDRVEERNIADRVAPRPLYIITLPYTASVGIEDRLTIGADTYEVIAPLDQTDPVQLRVAAAEVL